MRFVEQRERGIDIVPEFANLFRFFVGTMAWNYSGPDFKRHFSVLAPVKRKGAYEHADLDSAGTECGVLNFWSAVAAASVAQGGGAAINATLEMCVKKQEFTILQCGPVLSVRGFLQSFGTNRGPGEQVRQMLEFPIFVLPAAMDENARSTLECGSSSCRLSFSAPLTLLPYEPKSEGGGCCYRTPWLLRDSCFIADAPRSQRKTLLPMQEL
jgi:hypothetical protein